jgi:Flp pilus assembly protein TadD
MIKQKPKPARSRPVKTVIKEEHTVYWVIAGLILTLIVYIPSLTNGLTNWDDNIYVNSPYVSNLSLTGIVKIFSVYFAGNYHPFTLLSLGIDHLIGGNNPFMFHFTNLVLHLLNTLLVFLLVRRLTKNDLLAIFTFILFGVHTLHVESVAWVSERKDVLYSFFFLLSLTIYTSFASGRKGLYYGLSLLCFLLSLLAKGQAVILVVLLPFIDYVKGRKWFSASVLSEKIPFFLLSMIFSWVAFRAQESGHTLHFEYFSLPQRFAFASFGTAQYLIKSIIPFNLSAFYPYSPKLANGSIPAFYWLYLIFLPVFFTGFYFLFKRSKIYAFGLSLFFLSLLPLLQLIPVGSAIMADRYFYIPSVGLLLCFAFGLMEIKNTRIRYSIFILFILIFSIQSFSRCRIWKDSITLWDDVINKYPDLKDAFCNRGSAYGELGQWDKAVVDYSRMIEIDPKDRDGYYSRGVAYANLGQWEKAIANYSRAIEIDPKYPVAYYNQGIAFYNLREMDKAIANYSRAIEVDPNYALAYSNRGVAYAAQGQWEKAVTDFSKTIEIDPDDTKAYYNRDIAYKQLRSNNK